MPKPPEHAPAAAVLTIADATCTACGCLCDDIALRIAGGRIIGAWNACERGLEWFLADHGHHEWPDATVEGRPASVEDAIGRAAEILSQAKAPVVLGLTATTIEAQREAVALADRLGAVIAPTHAAEAEPLARAVQRVGRVSATLGEVKNRADVVVFWGVDPIRTHPRHWERYSVEPRGRFVPEGRASRKVLVADTERTATADRADLFLLVPADAQLEMLWTLRAALKGAEIDERQLERSTGIAAGALRDWADRLARARYGAFFFGPGLGLAPGGAACVEAALLLVRDLNATGRFVALTLGSPGNAAGAEAVLTWQTGCPLGADFQLGYPRDPAEGASVLSLLEQAQADAALIVADDVMSSLPLSAREHLARIPTVVIAPDATSPPRSATVAIASATYGIHTPGTVVRYDGVSLPLRPALTTNRPTDRDLLQKIAARVRSPRLEEYSHAHA
ncbi:MAG TPA: formylmethanofuran dehydrogenase subunit B [Isosphaeraceae bacterium]|jgi:formylmethanofuran dehydrogenase subunit B|nr:formylmethanofuran dehydrogenase subunit B [Isosphaeraceae bacterium]